MPTLLASYRATPRNVAYLLERACVAAANAESEDAIGWRNLFARDARNLISMARKRLADNLA